VEMWATRVDPIVGSSDVTDDAQWTSDNPAVATVGASLRSKAIVTAIAAGTAHITASVRGHSASATVTVSAGTLQSIAIAPSNATFPVGFLRFRAIGQYSDGTSQDITELAQWGTSDAGIASIARGEAYLDTPGQTPVTVSLCTRNATISGSTNVTVTPLTVMSMAVSATQSTIKKGERTSLSAVATYSDGSTSDFTPACESWWADNADVAVPAFDRANPNDVVGIAAGTTNIECVRAQGVRGMTAITVTP
jgi:trimeric autotransporter adhesin